MPANLSPRELTLDTQKGYRRMRNFRQARLMFMRAFLGQYYDSDHGKTGQEPLNLVFHAMRTLLPQIVMSNPTYNFNSEFVEYRDYGDLLALALKKNAKQLKLKDTFRLWMVDSILGGMGVLKTGLATSGSVITFDDENDIDPGQVYTDHVDFGNFVFDPNLRGPMSQANWMGDIQRVKRSYLLDSGYYNNALVEKLPKAEAGGTGEMSRKNIQTDSSKWDDEVEVAELWVPGAQSIVTVPAPMVSHSGGVVFDEFLREEDAFCPNDGPYTFLSLTPPVPANPMSIAPVGVWYDLHVMANRMAVKTMAQADRQKDIVVYRRSAADDAQEALDAPDGMAIGLDDPEGIQTVSFGGQKNENLAMTSYLQTWFNMMAANPQAVGGQALDADSATEAQILQANSDVGINDMRNLVYEAAAEEGSKRAWYIHTDPLMNIPLARRQEVMTENGPQPRDETVVLTPELRRGDFIDFHFDVEPESMTRMDTQTRIQRAMEFVASQLPAAVQTGMLLMQMGQPFHLPSFITRLAKEAGIDWMDEVWFDPMFQQKIQYMMMQSPQFQKAALAPEGQTIKQPNGAGSTMGGGKSGPLSPFSMMMSQAQEGANSAQAGLDVRPAQMGGFGMY